MSRRCKVANKRFIMNWTRKLQIIIIIIQMIMILSINITRLEMVNWQRNGDMIKT